MQVFSHRYNFDHKRIYSHVNIRRSVNYVCVYIYIYIYAHYINKYRYIIIYYIHMWCGLFILILWYIIYIHCVLFNCLENFKIYRKASAMESFFSVASGKGLKMWWDKYQNIESWKDCVKKVELKDFTKLTAKCCNGLKDRPANLQKKTVACALLWILRIFSV